MATYSAYTPTTVIGQAMFNFDPYGISNFKLNGTVYVSVSDGFSFYDWYYGYFDQNLVLATYDVDTEISWSIQTLVNIEKVLSTYSEFASIPFNLLRITTPMASTLRLIRRKSVLPMYPISTLRGQVTAIHLGGGISGGALDSTLNYSGSAGDIILNWNYSAFNDGHDFGEFTKASQVLMHELGHSIGLSHPHSSYDIYGAAVITTDFAATRFIGFDQLGFRTSSAADMNKKSIFR